MAILVNCQSKSPTPKVTVDLSIPSKKKESVAGFLHFNELESIESDIRELKPKFWRFGAKLKEHTPKRKQQVDVLLKNDIVPIIVLSDIYDEEHWYKEKGGWIRPSDDPRNFTALVKKLLIELSNKTVFDVWNEPDLKEVWGGSREEYFRTFKVAHDALRTSKNGENAQITGPSISSYNKEYIAAFLKYCNDNKLKLDILNWHSLGNQKDALQLKKNINEAKEMIAKYPNLGVKNIYIPEIIGPDDQFVPLTVMAYIDILEKSNVSGGCKACWDNPKSPGENSCWNNSMDGILTPGGKKRSTWWAYKYYADSLNKRLSASASSTELVSISYYDDNGSLNLLIGILDGIDYGNIDLEIKNIADIKRFKNMFVNLYKVPNSGAEYLEKPVFVSKNKFTIGHNSINITLKNIESQTFYRVVLSQ